MRSCRPRPAAHRDRYWLHVLLFLSTIVSTTPSGRRIGSASCPCSDSRPVLASLATLAVQGLWYSLTMLAILGAHELGHYLACRYYRVSASLPYFLPIPFPLTGNGWARSSASGSRSPPSRRCSTSASPARFAGFVVAIPALFVGIAMSNVVPLPPVFSGAELGEPLLFKLAEWLVWGTSRSPLAQPAPDGLRRVVRPAGDGAEPLSDRAARRRAHRLRGLRPPLALRHDRHHRRGDRPELLLVSLDRLDRCSPWCCCSSSAGGTRGRGTKTSRSIARASWLALVALVIFVLCFTPAPIEPLDHPRQVTPAAGLRSITAPSADRRRSIVRRLSSGRSRRARPSPSRMARERRLPFTKNCARCSPFRRASGAGAGPAPRTLLAAESR